MFILHAGYIAGAQRMVIEEINIELSPGLYLIVCLETLPTWLPHRL